MTEGINPTTAAPPAATSGRASTHGASSPATTPARDVLTPREVAERAGFSYHAILRAIRRGDLQAFEPVPGHYRIELEEYERWLHRPARCNLPSPPQPTPRREHRRATTDPAQPGSLARLRAIQSSS
jgi:excisionase family DNA binding protein